jgi:hypothetical protein
MANFLYRNRHKDNLDAKSPGARDPGGMHLEIALAARLSKAVAVARRKNRRSGGRRSKTVLDLAVGPSAFRPRCGISFLLLVFPRRSVYLTANSRNMLLNERGENGPRYR